ncbi:DUF3379 family protein [Flavobacterium sp. W21_SRS_FM6]|uniref:DUF3379 family protein n=1 Tax=Flavobacterium sp. W21_SRS_FM6 TaxID=3240268 RepID=UPI003F9018D3
MDELEFRRAVLADPNDKELAKATADDLKKQAFVKEIKQLDKKITEASNIPVPDGLAHRLLLRQTMAVHTQKRQRSHFIQLALAASVAFILGISVTQWQFKEAASLSEYGIAHVLHEGDYALGASEDISLSQVNAKLARFGGEMTANTGQIYYANFCDFDNIKSLHLVMQGDNGKVSVFIVPNMQGYAIDSAVKGKWNSEAYNLSKASLVIVSDVPSDVARMRDRLSKSIQFSA